VNRIDIPRHPASALSLPDEQQFTDFETLRRIEAEQREFADILAHLRDAKDKAELDAFLQACERSGVSSTSYFGLSSLAGCWVSGGLLRRLERFARRSCTRCRRIRRRRVPVPSPVIGLSGWGGVRAVPPSPGIGLSTWLNADGTARASAAETVSKILGTATPTTPTSPRSESALRRESCSGSSVPPMSNLLTPDGGAK
jgi:uncharacterized protein DUF2852